jgi:Xaa-Pro aminopeptidase
MISSQEWRTELTARRNAVWASAERHECDLALIFGSFGHAEPFRYLTNFVPVLGDAWGILTAPDGIAGVLNFSWQLEEARQISGIQEWYGVFDPVPTVVELLAQRGPKRIGMIGMHRLPVTAFDSIKAALPNAAFVDIGDDVALLRRQKSDLEIRLLREACRITDAAFDAIRAEIRPGVTEYELAARLAYLMHSMGAELSFEPTVVSGIDEPIPIRMPTARRLQSGDSVMIDIGAMVQGYQADATRTYVLGKPNAEQQKVWKTIEDAYDAAFEHIHPGISCIDSHKAAVKVIEQAGYSLRHRIGHGIGLATSFEWPSLDTEIHPLLPGTTICIEPGIYVPGAGNMKLEDDALVTETGYELLTHSTREPMVAV